MQKMQLELKSGSRHLPRERMDVSPADLERQCGLGTACEIGTVKDRAYQDRGK